MRRCVIVQMYGLGNMVLATPLIQAMKQAGYAVDVLVEHGRAAHLPVKDWPEVVDNLWFGSTPAGTLHDLALFCHPIGGYTSRVQASVLDDIRVGTNPKGYLWAFGDHEVRYLMAMATRHGWKGDIPPLRVPRAAQVPTIRKPAVALGIGYLKDHVRWHDKHWGNQKYAALAAKLHGAGVLPVLVGGDSDRLDATEIERASPCVINTCGKLEFPQTVSLLAECVAYIGNDSGLMHVAAAVQIPTIGIFLTTNPVKNSPWCKTSVVLSNPVVETAVNETMHWVLGSASSWSPA